MRRAVSSSPPFDVCPKQATSAPGLRKAERNRLTDPASGAGDECDVPLEAEDVHQRCSSSIDLTCGELHHGDVARFAPVQDAALATAAENEHSV